MTTPRVFVSYSHDSEDHKRWVLNLATVLRKKGVDAVLDQWDLRPGKDVALFMEEQLEQCDFALLICTQRYVEKANAGKGGVGYEKMILSAELVKEMDAGTIIPIVRENGDSSVPSFISSKRFMDFTSDEYFDIQLDELLRTLFGAEIATKPPLGESPEFGPKSEKSSHEGVARYESGLSIEAFEVFQLLVESYDVGDAAEWRSDEIANMIGFGRVTTDAVIVELVQAGILLAGDIDLDDSYLYRLTDKGKVRARNLGLVQASSNST